MKKNQTISSKLSYGILYLFSGSVGAMLISIVTIGLIARKLGVNNFGLYTSVTAAVGLFQFITNLGVNRAILKEGSHNIEQAKTAFGNALLLKSLIMIPFIGIVLGYGYFAKYEQADLFLLFIFSMIEFLDSFGAVYLAIRRIFGDFELISIARVIRYGFNLLGIYIAFKFNVSVELLGMGLLSISFISFVVATINSIQKLPPKLNPKELPDLMKDASIFSMNEFFSKIYTRITVVILAAFSPLNAIGIFGIAIRFTRFATIFPRQVRSAVLPTIYRIIEGEKETKEDLIRDIERAKRVFKTMLKYTALIAAPLIIFIYDFSGPITTLVVGNKYNKAIPLIQVLSFFVFYRFIQTPFSLYYIGLNKHKDMVKLQSISTAILIAFCYLLIPTYTSMGACYALVISEYAFAALLTIDGLRYSIWTLKDSVLLTINPVISSGLAFYLTSFFQINIFSKMIIFSVLYLIVLIISKQLKKNDFEFVKKVVLRK